MMQGSGTEQIRARKTRLSAGLAVLAPHIVQHESKMQYKFDFVTSTIIQAFMGTYDYMVTLAILWRFKTVAGWNIYEVGILYAISKIGWGLYRAFLEEVERFEGYIVRGEFDSILIRPWPSLFTLISRNFEINEAVLRHAGFGHHGDLVRAAPGNRGADLGRGGSSSSSVPVDGANLLCRRNRHVSGCLRYRESGRTASLHSERDADRFSVSPGDIPELAEVHALTVIPERGNYVPSGTSLIKAERGSVSRRRRLPPQ